MPADVFEGRSRGPKGLRIKPCTLKQANELVNQLHRHHKPVRGHRFSLSCWEGEVLRGVVICGRPVARGCDPDLTLEVTRCATDGTKNVISKLYGAVCKAAKAMGFEKVQTYTLVSEGGASMRASNFTEAARVRGRAWKHTTGPRANSHPLEDKVRWEKLL